LIVKSLTPSIEAGGAWQQGWSLSWLIFERYVLDL